MYTVIVWVNINTRAKLFIWNEKIITKQYKFKIILVWNDARISLKFLNGVKNKYKLFVVFSLAKSIF